MLVKPNERLSSLKQSMFCLYSEYKTTPVSAMMKPACCRGPNDSPRIIVDTATMQLSLTTPQSKKPTAESSRMHCATATLSTKASSTLTRTTGHSSDTCATMVWTCAPSMMMHGSKLARKHAGAMKRIMVSGSSLAWPDMSKLWLTTFTASDQELTTCSKKPLSTKCSSPCTAIMAPTSTVNSSVTLQRRSASRPTITDRA
mmetsp:Transcript_62031/g.144346  ORF Transcript_62031/g.144346 Transcript_62031/m.144346 type:complete len:201 (-) Transcript_62031:605-1207(-)